MEKNRINWLSRSFFVFAVVVFAIISNSCEVGLGETVDVLPPTLSLNYPPTNSVIKDTFVLSGTVEDDTVIENVSIRFENLDFPNRKTFGPYYATVTKNKTYTLDANKKKSDGSFDIPDGKYETIITALDSAGRETSVNRTLIIDNTPPLLVLSQPSTIHTDFSFQQYGTTINITGAIGESNSVNKLVVEAYWIPSGSTIASATLRDTYIAEEIFPQNLDHRIDITDSFYTNLYKDLGSGVAPSPYVDKHYYFKIFIKDNAREYKNPGDGGTGDGNASDGYFINNTDFVTTVGNTHTTLDVYSMFNGTYSKDASGEINTGKETIATTTRDNLDKIRIKQSESDKLGTFTLNPENSPSWALLGVNPFGDKVVPNGFATFNGTGVITIKANRGRDAMPLDPDTISVSVYNSNYTSEAGFFPVGDPIVAFPALDDTFTPAEVESRARKISASGQGYEITLSLDALGKDDDTSLTPAEYFVVVQGVDSNGMGFLQLPEYGFEIVGSEMPPAINNALPSKDTYIKLNGKVTITAEIEANSGEESPRLWIDLFDGVTGDRLITTMDVASKHSYSLPIDFAQLIGENPIEQGIYDIRLRAREQGKLGETEKEFKLIYDTTIPVIEITGISPLVDNADDVETVNGIITVNGTMSDAFDKLNPETLLFTINGLEESVVANSVDGLEWVSTVGEMSTFKIPERFNGLKIDTTKITAESLKLNFFAADRAGNEATVSRSYIIDQNLDKPVVELSSADMTKADGTAIAEADIAFGTNFFGKTASFLLEGTITDDDGIASLEIAVYVAGTANESKEWTAIPLKIGTTSASWRYDVSGLAEGIYQVELRAKDTVYATSNSAYNKYDSVSFAIGVIESKPTISVLSPAQGAYYTGTIPVQLSWTDIFSKDDATKPTITARTGEGAIVPVTGTWNNNTWTESLAVGSTGASRSYTIKDRFAQTITAIFTYKVDLVPPTIVSSAGVPAGTVVNLPSSPFVRITGTAEDAGFEPSGLDEVKYIVVKTTDSSPLTTGIPTDWTAWTAVSGRDSWLASVDMTGKEQGSYIIHLFAKDLAGNYSPDALKYTVAVDTDVPIITVNQAPADGAWNKTSYTVDFTDTWGLTSYDISLQGADDSLKTGVLSGTNSGAITFSDTTALAIPAGEGNLIFTVKDKSGKVVTKTVPYKKDVIDPVIELTNVDALTGAVNGVAVVNGVITINGVITDLNLDTSKLTFTINGPSTSVVSGATPVTGSSTSVTSTFKIPARFNGLEIDTTKINDAAIGKVELTFSAMDEAGNKASVASTIAFNQNFDKPTIELSNANINLTDDSLIKDGTNFFGKSSNNELKGRMTDDDGIAGLKIAFYALGAAVPASPDWRVVSLPLENPTTATWTYDLSTLEASIYPEGIYNVLLQATDKNNASSPSIYNKTTTTAFLIGIVESTPTIEVTSPAQNAFTTEGVSVKLKWEDKFASEKLPTIVATKKGGLGNGTADLITGTADNKTWTETLVPGNEDSTRVYTITDRYGQTASAEFTYRVDLNPPTITSLLGIPDDKKIINSDSPDVRIEGTATDGTVGSPSGLDQVRYIVVKTGGASPLAAGKPIKWADWSSANTTPTALPAPAIGWTAVVEFDTLLSQGVYDIYLVSKDFAENYSSEIFSSGVLEYEVTLDAEKPTMTGFPDSTIWNQPNYTINFADKVQLASYTVSLEGSSVPLKTGDLSGTAQSKTFTVGNDVGELKIPDGTGNLIFTVTDKSGKVAESLPVPYKRDTISPVINVANVPAPIVGGTSPVDGIAIVNGIITINGTITDTNLPADAKKLTFTINGPKASVDETTGVATWKSTTGEGTANELSTFTIPANFDGLKIDTTEIAHTDGEGTVTLDFSATDEAGKEGTLSRSIAFDQNLDKPVVALTNVVSEKTVGGASTAIVETDIKFGTNFFGKTANNELLGTIADDDGIKTLEIAIYKEIAGLQDADWKPVTVTPNLTSSTWSYNVTKSFTEADFPEGIYHVKLRATDNVEPSGAYNVSTSPVYIIGIVESKPTISIVSPAQNTYYKGNKDVVLSWTDEFATDVTLNISGEEKTGDGSFVSSSIDFAAKTWTETLAVGTGDGSRTYTIIDRFGQTASTTFNYKVDTTEPTIELTSTSPEGKVVNLPDYSSIRITGNATDANLDEVKYIVVPTTGDSPLTADANPKPADWTAWTAVGGFDTWTANVDMTGKTYGSYDIYLVSKDSAGNYSSETGVLGRLKYTVAVDTEEPTIGGLPTEPTVWNETQYVVTFGDRENLASYRVRLQDGTPLIVGNPASEPVLITGMSKEITFTVGTATGNLNIPDGKGNLIFTVTDKSGKVDEQTVAYMRDKELPVINVANVPAPEIDGETSPVDGFDVVNGIITINGTITDTNLDTGDATATPSIPSTLKVTINGPTDSVVGLTLVSTNYVVPAGGTLASGGSTFTIPANFDGLKINTTKIAHTDGEGTVTLDFSATDKAGNEGTLARSIEFDQKLDKPVVTVSNAEMLADDLLIKFGKNFFENGSSILKGSIADDDGIASFQIAVYKAGEEATKVWKSLMKSEELPTGVVLGAKDAQWSYDFKDLLYGIYWVELEATDSVGSSATYNKTTTTAFPIAYVTSTPTITLATESPAPNTYYKGDINVVLNWTDVFADTQMPTITPTGDGTGSNFGPNFNTEKWTETLTVGSSQGDNTRKYTITDRFGQTASTSFAYKVDTIAPAITEVTGVPAGTVVNLPTDSNIPIKGTALDEGSELSAVKYTIVVKNTPNTPPPYSTDSQWNTDWVSVSGLGDWTANVNMSGKTSGQLYDILVVARDSAGNYSNVLRYPVGVDNNPPNIKNLPTTAAWGVTRYNNVVFEDKEGLANYKISIQGKDDFLKDVDLSSGLNVTTLSQDFTVGTVSGNLNVPDGKGNLIFTVTDKSGKVAEYPVPYQRDMVPPTIVFTNVAEATSFISKNDRIYASFTDVTSGYQSISYSFQKGVEAALPTKTLTADSGTTSLNLAIPLTNDGNDQVGSGPVLSDGTWALTVNATDVAGNSSTTVANFRIDTNAPSVQINSPDSNGIVQMDALLTVSGTATDLENQPLDKVVVSVTHPSYNSDQKNKFTKVLYSAAISSGTWSWSFPETPFLHNEVYTISAVAHDQAGNTRESIVFVSCDADAPTFTFNRPYPSKLDGVGKPIVIDYVYKTTQTTPTIGVVRVEAIANDFRMKEIYYQIGKEFVVTTDGATITKIQAPLTVGLDAGSFENPSSGLLGGYWMKAEEVGTMSVDIDTTSLVDFVVCSTSGCETPENCVTLDHLKVLYVHVVGIDAANNIGYAKYPIKLDTDLDKPQVQILSPEGTSASVGGAFVVSGSATDNTGVGSVYMQIEVSNGNYDTANDLVNAANSADFFGTAYPDTANQKFITAANVSDGSFTITTDSEVNSTKMFRNKTTWYQISGKSGWSHLLNKNGKFNATKEELGRFITGFTANDPEPAIIEVRIMAIDDKGDPAGSMIRTITVTIDGGSPSIVPTEETSDSSSIPKANESVSGLFPFSITITDDDAVSNVTFKANGVDVNDLFKFTSSDTDKTRIYTGTVGTGSIQIDSAGLAKKAKSNVIKLEIVATDNSNKTSNFTRTFVIDNAAPTAEDHVDGGKIGTSLVDGTAPREPNDRGNHLRVKTTEALFEGRVRDEGNGSGVKRLFFYFTQGTAVDKKVFSVRSDQDNTPNGTVMTNTLSVYDSNNELTAVEVPFNLAHSNFDPANRTGAYIVVDTAEGFNDSNVGTSNGDNDGFEENLRVDGFWGVNFDSTKLKDGVYDINIIIEDNAGNKRYYKDSMLVQNNAPVITHLILATDVNGDGSIVSDPLAVGFEGLKLTPDKFMDNRFQVRNNSLYVEVMATGDNVPLKYYLKGKTLVSPTVDVPLGVPDTTNPVFEWVNKPEQFPVPTDAIDKYITYTTYVVDNLASGSSNLNLASSALEFRVELANTDTEAPVAQLDDLNTKEEENGWNVNGRDGSLYSYTDPVTNTRKITGHVEPRVGTYSEIIEEQQASGKVILRGRVSDNHSISKIAVTVGTVPEIVVAKLVAGSGLTAQVNATIKPIPGGDAFADVVYEWSLVWDTELLPDIAKRGVSIKVTATDGRGPTYTSAPVLYADATNQPTLALGDTAKHYNSGTVDVVPYITSLSRDTLYNTTRSRLGYYGLLRGENLHVEGFNVKLGDVHVKVDASTSFDTTNRMVTLDASSVGVVPITAKSGYVSVVVNGIESSNNKVLGTDDAEHNKENDLDDAATALWTNDRYMYVWSSSNDANDVSHKFPGSDGAVYSSMTKNADGQLYSSFVRNDTATVSHSKLGGNATIIGMTPAPSLYTDISVLGTDVFIGFLANYKHITGNNSNWERIQGKSGGIFIHSEIAPEINTYAGSFNGASSSLNYYPGERLGHDGKFLQFENIRTVAAISGGQTVIHTVYYDTDTSSIKYSGVLDGVYGSGDQYADVTDTSIAWINIDGTKNPVKVSDDGNATEDLGKSHDEGASWLFNGKNYIPSTYVKDTNYEGLSRTPQASPYVALDVDEDALPVIVYIDAKTSQLRLARANSTLPRAFDARNTTWDRYGDTETASNAWKVQAVGTVSNASDHVAIKIDSTGTAHIAYRDTRGQLCYIQSTNDGSGTVPYTFSEAVVIDDEGAQWIDLALDGTTPYVSYMPRTDSYDAMKMAYYDATRNKWEYMPVPLNYKPQNDRSHIETNVNFGADSANKMKVAIGFGDGNDFRAVYLVD